VQEQLLGFINKEVIEPIGRHHVAKFARSRVSTTTFATEKEKSTKEESAWFRFLG
jgi:hypothetical protein